MTRRRGFTILELVIALSLASVVFMAIVGIAAQVVRWEIESRGRGSNTGWTLLSLQRMNRELQLATVLYCPYRDASHFGCPGPESDVLSGCGNYSFLNGSFGGANDASQPITAFYYCVGPLGSAYAGSLLRYEARGIGASCPMAAPACGEGSPEVIARRVSRMDPTATYFKRRDDAGGVQVRYVVGSSDRADAQNKELSAPIFTVVDSVVSMSKVYGNPSD
ncbi:MAG: prepilin-type N-terminal cleavage/methylation domain-containing protein [Elusimicrobia bacterium]|nr:prepilin-type N-terminal cleavage/methylation domain-containing protein [Elusimicrobiota bacterium]